MLSKDFSIMELPHVNVIRRIMPHSDVWPKIAPTDRVVIWIGAHRCFQPKEVCAIEKFVRTHNAVVFCDRTSNYHGVGSVETALLFARNFFANPEFKPLIPDLIIHLGEISGDYYTYRRLGGLAPVWRVSEDGEVKDPLRSLTCVFEMQEAFFFEHFGAAADTDGNYLNRWKTLAQDIVDRFPEVPFSNIWIAKKLANEIPQGSCLHLGILNSLRAWNFNTSSTDSSSYANVGGFGIDGTISTLVGASLVNSERLYFGVVGDLSFFYDLNAIGNRHIGKNLRILVVNNGIGVEFHLPSQTLEKEGDAVNDYVAAGGHFGRKSKLLLRHMAEDLGFAYISAATKEEFKSVYSSFITPTQDRPILFECFVNPDDDVSALREIYGMKFGTHGDEINGCVNSMGTRILGKAKRIVRAVIK